MTIKFKNKSSKLITFLLTGLILFSSCKDDKISDPSEIAPERPPISSMKIDFNNFPSSSGLSKINDQNSIQTIKNWGWASFNGVVWQTLVTAGMIVPVAAFAESFNHEAELQSDGSWLWTYDFTPITGIKHTASLRADADLSGVNWEMYITKENVYADFLWFSGQSDLLGTEGTWNINFEPNNPTPWIDIEWHRNPADSTADIKYTNIVPGGAENGAYIHYGKTNDMTYDAFYEIFNKGEDNMTIIKWNLTSHIGRVKDSKHFGDSDWHCWDENLQDVVCE
ncbi:MAG: hypothetical protein OQJ81_04875 [Melioribacteraceae bacterium]|nr:hypothetical protein [Melioribacteraceae bacterium]